MDALPRAASPAHKIKEERYIAIRALLRNTPYSKGEENEILPRSHSDKGRVTVMLDHRTTTESQIVASVATALAIADPEKDPEKRTTVSDLVGDDKRTAYINIPEERFNEIVQKAYNLLGGAERQLFETAAKVQSQASPAR